ncbi:probable H/ACA ribonucleoprotein complex subunit 1 [Penaeus japonicus]|uniref:probable H/ACA ribonucleoprotein complex subunit 1 n=1 Tax=Penaeus japonicus TaxID=27405 RepID=UPI001C70FE76|nr:probable H/ACA ribonucleoprotein complex subunit 1 [Penaeus japonicus]
MAFNFGVSASASAAAAAAGSGSGASAASASAVAGAISLGFAGLANFGGGFFGGRGGGGRGGGRGRGRFNRRRGGRRGREVGDNPQAAHNRLMDVIAQEDETGCGKRLVCELAAVEAEEERQLLMEELAILEFVGDITPGEDLTSHASALEYKLAKRHGMEGRDCGFLYPSCIYNGTEIMSSVLAYLS